MRAYGAKVVIAPTAVPPEDERSYYKVAEKIVNETPNAFNPNQYYNPDNPKAHLRQPDRKYGKRQMEKPLTL